MVSLSVKELKVVNLENNEVYDVYGIVHDHDFDYFIVFNERLKKKRSGFNYLKVMQCMPYEEERLLG